MGGCDFAADSWFSIPSIGSSGSSAIANGASGREERRRAKHLGPGKKGWSTSVQ